MSIKKESFLTFIGFVLIVLMGYALWLALSFFVSVIKEADPKIAAAILGAMATVFVGLTAVIITQKQTSAREREEAHRSKKVEIYQKYLETVTALLSGQNDQVSQSAPTEQELVDYLVQFKTELILWGSPEVIKRQLEFQLVTLSGGDIFEAIDKIHRAIRADIGLSNKGLSNLELVKMYLSDPSELDRVRATNNKIKSD
ncbi:hypothetical protein tloyanaT_32240 [Thalassotalea loyana]|uniref:DUF4760 domain-containing protein n=1 Tax=Thalassotalea loyana TaxID=280483 RepID=A0ABQ6HIX9_9GAMM|nr:hypothetical protein [Thalassotalea loyana]GLX86971.1 hypothetical protein tloyanaT_32240 [Thalassotalea loyana]